MDSVDFELVNALQEAPRISWSRLEGVVGVDATTLARRWHRLVELGVAWSSCYPVDRSGAVSRPLGVLALVEVQCVAGEREHVIDAISAVPHVLSVECKSGSRDLALLVERPTVADIDRFVSTDLGELPGVRSTRTQFTPRYFKEGSDWRLDALSAAQQRALQVAIEQSGSSIEVPPVPSALHLEVVKALAVDVRRSASSIAEELSRSVTTVTRAINQALHSTWAATRVDIAHAEVGYGATVMVWFTVPPLLLDAVGVGIGLMHEARMCCSVVGRSNLVASFWMRDMSELEVIERRVVKAFPTVRIDDRWMITRTPKRMGHRIGVDGRRLR